LKSLCSFYTRHGAFDHGLRQFKPTAQVMPIQNFLHCLEVVAGDRRDLRDLVLVATMSVWTRSSSSPLPINGPDNQL